MSAHADETGRPTGLHRVIRVVTSVEIALAGLAMAVIFVLVLVQAGQRYLPIDGWTWTGELARYSLVWLTFVAIGVLITRDGHIALQIVDSIRSEVVVRSIHVFALVVVAVASFGFASACWSLIEEQRNLSTPSLGLPMAWVYVLPLLGFISSLIRSVVAAVQVARHGVPERLDEPSLDLGLTGESRA